MRSREAVAKLPRFIKGLFRPLDGGAHLSILIYHRVLAREDPLRPGLPLQRDFTRHMELLRRHFRPIGLSEGVQRVKEGTLERRSVCVTFDDGYADNLAVAAPILVRFGIPATVFVASGFLEDGVMWNDRVIEAVGRAKLQSLDAGFAGLPVLPLANDTQRQHAISRLLKSLKYRTMPERAALVDSLEKTLEAPPCESPMLTISQLRELPDMGIDIGAHTCNHPILACEEDSVVRDEIVTSKSRLEALMQKDIHHFAYPNGCRGKDYNDTHVKIVREAGFAAAVSTDNGLNTRGVDIMQLHRFTPWDVSSLRFGARLYLNEHSLRN